MRSGARSQHDPTMSHPIDNELVRHLAHLARLDMSDEDVAVTARELTQIVGYIDQLSQVDTEGVEPTAHAIGIRNVLRDDTIRPSLEQNDALTNAAQQEDGFFRVPKVLDNESDA